MQQQSFGVSVSEGARTKSVQTIGFNKITDLATYIQRAPAVVDKLDSRAIVMAKFANGLRSNDTLVESLGLALDYDTPNPGDMEAVSAALEIAGISYVAFGTHSNHGRFAVVIPFSRATDVQGHAAAIADIRTVLGSYATFAPESERAGQLRFVASNPQYPNRKLVVFEGSLYQPQVKSSNVTQLPTPIRTQDTFAEIANPAHKALFNLALANNLLPEDRLDNYLRWQPLLFAAFRAFGFNSDTKFTEAQREVLELLNRWSAQHSKFQPGCVEAKLADYLSNPSAGTMLHISSVLAKEVNLHQLREHAIYDGDLIQAVDKLGGAPIKLIPEEVLERANIERHAHAELEAQLNLQALTVLSRMPAPTPRFEEFRELLVRIATQGQAGHAELDDKVWPYFLNPINTLLGIVQVASFGFAPHTMFRYSNARPPKGLNLYSLAIAPAGSGKSTLSRVVKNLIGGTVFKFSVADSKIHSAAGVWQNHIEKHGPALLIANDEAESVFGKKGAGGIDQHLAAYHTWLKTAFDSGIAGVRSRPSVNVQREVKEVTGVTVAMNLAATDTILNDIADAMLTDGFMSRLITVISDAANSGETVEEEEVRRMLEMDADINTSTEVLETNMRNFIVKAWRDSNHPGGHDFFTFMPETPSSDLATLMTSHFEREDLPLRYIRPPADVPGRRKFAKLCMQASDRWPTPGGSSDSAKAAVNSLAARAEIKLQVMASILTLMADPLAERVDIEIMEWCEEVLWLAQRRFYKHLLSVSDNVSMLPGWKTNKDYVDRLRPALREGGPLFAGSATSRELIHFSRPWRTLVAALKLDHNDEKYKAAATMLSEINVGYSDGKGARIFFIEPDSHVEF